MKRKISFIGGGSLRTLGLIRDWLLQGAVAEDSSIAIMDVDARRAAIVSCLSGQMPEAQGRNVRFCGTTDLGEALEGADFIYNVVRVGGIAGMDRDKRIALRYGFHGHDDFGPSAAMIVLRTVPEVLKIAVEMEKRCPDAWLLNFTNPVPFIVRAVKDFSKIRVMGICGGDENQLYDIPTTLGWPEIPCQALNYRGVGIDHFSWSTELTFEGKPFYPVLLKAIQKLDRGKLPYHCRMSVEALELYGQWLSSSAHCFHWTHHDEMAAMLRDHYAEIDRGERIARTEDQDRAMDAAEQCVGKDLGIKFWEQPALKPFVSRPGYAARGIRIIAAMLADKGDEFMVNIHAPGAAANLQDDGIVLISARMRAGGPEPLRFQGVPDGIAPLTRQILDYQKALVHAAVHGNRRDLEVALLTDPIMRDVSKMRAMLDELLEADKDRIRSDLLKR